MSTLWTARAVFDACRIQGLFGDPMYFVRGFENCIYVYSEEKWQKMAEDIRNLPWSSDAARWVKRIWFSSSLKVRTDPKVAYSYLRSTENMS